MYNSSSTPDLPTDSTRPRIAAISLEFMYSGVKLDKLAGNYTTWVHAMTNHLTLVGLYDYVFQPPPEPTQTIEPTAHKNWTNNNRLTAAIVVGGTSEAEQDFLDIKKGAKACWDSLKERHQKEGRVKQVKLLQTALSTKVSSIEPPTVTARNICDMIDRAFSIDSEIDADRIKCIAILNALDNDLYSSARSLIFHHVSESTDVKPYTSHNIRKFLEIEQSFHNNDEKNAQTPSIRPVTQANNSEGRGTPGPITPTCTNCVGRGRANGGRGHLIKYCVRPGGGMAGKTIDESRAERKRDLLLAHASRSLGHISP